MEQRDVRIVTYIRTDSTIEPTVTRQGIARLDMNGLMNFNENKNSLKLRWDNFENSQNAVENSTIPYISLRATLFANFIDVFGSNSPLDLRSHPALLYRDTSNEPMRTRLW